MFEISEQRVVARGKRYVKYVEIVPTEDATGLVAAVYEQIARGTQLLPLAVLHSSAPELVAGAWGMLRETLLVGKVPRLIKEAVAIGADAADLVAIARWASRVPAKDTEAPPRGLFHELDVSEILGTAVALHYFNRMVSVFLESAPISLPLTSWCTEHVSGHPGGDMASAFARMARVVDSVALELIPEGVRTLVANRIARWNGEGARLSLSWIENTTRVLHTMDRPLAALLLLTSLGSHQVDSRLVAAVRKACPEPHDWSRYLVSVVAWAAFTAARRVGTCMEAALRDEASCCTSAGADPECIS